MIYTMALPTSDDFNFNLVYDDLYDPRYDDLIYVGYYFRSGAIGRAYNNEDPLSLNEFYDLCSQEDMGTSSFPTKDPRTPVKGNPHKRNVMLRSGPVSVTMRDGTEFARADHVKHVCNRSHYTGVSADHLRKLRFVKKQNRPVRKGCKKHKNATIRDQLDVFC